MSAAPQNTDVETPQESNIPSDEQILQGGPVEEVVASEEIVAEPEPEAPVFKWGNKEFKTKEELEDFINDLDKKATKNAGYEEALAKINAIQATPEPAPEPENVEPEKIMVDGKPVGEAVWEDPDKAFDAVTAVAVERAKAAIRAEQVQQKQVDDLWNNFYTQNPDLADVQDQVDLILAKNKAELYKMPTTEALNKLATLTRGELKRIREKFSNTENLGDAPAIVASSTPAAPSQEPVQEIVKDVAFIDQVRQFQSKYFS